MIRPRLSLRARLIAGMALVAVVLLGVSALITAVTRDRLMSQVDARLEALSPTGRLPFPSDGDGSFPGADTGGDTPDQQPPGGWQDRVSDVYEGFIDESGELRTRFSPNVGGDDYGSPVIDAADLPTRGSALFTTDADSGSGTYRVLAQRVDAGDTEVVTITAVPLDGVQQTISRVVWVQAGGAAVILAVLGLVGWWVLHLGIRPVKEMTATATRIADGDLDVRVPEGAEGTESGDLARSLNAMLTRITAALDERAASEDRLRRFVADASHELRTPVTTIRGYAELYRHGGLAENDTLDDAMRRTEQEATRMGRLIEDMLTLAKFDEQRPLASRPVDLVMLAGDAVRDARAVAPERPIDLVRDAESAVVDGDEDRLRQVLANIVGNALVHTDPDVRVEVHVAADAGQATLEVRDHGQGMPREVAARVTERFFRADPARARNRGGSGLGLSIVDAAVAAHDGTLTIDSAPGEGTCVRLVLPIHSQL